MPEESRIKLSPVDGGDPFLVPLGKVTIGRGTFLQVFQIVSWFMNYELHLQH